MNKDMLMKLKSYVDELKTVGWNLVKNSEDDYLKIRNWKVLLNNGRTIKRGELIKGNGNGSAVVVLPVTKEGKIVLVVQPRVFTEQTVAVELPAGYIEKGENPEIGGRRELQEETGYTGGDMQLLGRFYQDQGCSRAGNYYYVMFDCKKTSHQNLDSDEIVRVIEVTYEELGWLIDNQYIQDVNSVLAVERAKEMVKRKVRK